MLYNFNCNSHIINQFIAVKPPKIITPPKDVTAPEQGPATFTSKITGFPAPTCVW